jgi:hypothetical protein
MAVLNSFRSKKTQLWDAPAKFSRAAFSISLRLSVPRPGARRTTAKREPGKTSRSPAEEAKFRRLAEELQFCIPTIGEMPVERRAQQLIDALLKDQLRAR